jgi:RHS repeat-associated protein
VEQGTHPNRDSGQRVSSPQISLPKGGGAIRGIGEKFAASPVTGTGSISVPIATSPGRSGFGPELSLSYDSGAGNGPFGFGWSLSLPQITRKTDKGLPRYDDAVDVFLLSGAEDLVPEYRKDGEGEWVRENGEHLIAEEQRTVNGVEYAVRRYRPRIEGLFARIERWRNQQTGETHWRSITRENITTLYGKDNRSRIFDPADPDSQHPTRIFSWLICESYDDKGNAIVYEYQPEDSARIFEDLQGQPVARAHERNRDHTTRSANRYLKRIKYGNRTPNRDAQGNATDPTRLTDWMFEVVFDYGEGHYEKPPVGSDENTPVTARLQVSPGSHWPARPDAFSSYRSGFEVRTYRLCQRVLMFHHFPDEEAVGTDCLVRSTDFTYSHEQDPESTRNRVYTFLLAVTQTGYKRQGGGYLSRSLPPVEFKYSQPIVDETVREVDAESLENLPIGLDGSLYQWTDLHGEGIPGILTEEGGAWFYKRNLSPLNVTGGNGAVRTDARFAPVERVATQPNLALAGGAQFMDLAGDGQPDLVVLDGPVPGLYEHDGEESWQPFRPFTARLNRDTRDPNLRFVDLDGDGHADVLVTEDDAFVWHPSLAEEGFGPARRIHQALDEERGPRLVFADGTQTIHLADLSGDGLTDLVRIRNGEVCYWPNLGYGRFGAKVTMDEAPFFDHPDQFDHGRVRLADIDGTGTTDIIYLHRDGVRLYFNQSGNSWSEPEVLHVFPRVDDLASITPIDLLGNGTACLVWSSPLPGDARRQMRYVDLMGGQKPHLLVGTVNNLGAETRVHYAPSSRFYLQDKRDGRPWITRLPFPVHVVERVETYDHISRNRFVTRYAYHHGYFDGEEREFRGFGMVEQWDTEEFAALTSDGALPAATNLDAASHVPPVHTKTWFHSGFYLDRQHISLQFEDEYYREPGLSDQEFRALLLPDTNLPTGLTLAEEREACRALKGMMLRQEVYADDAPPGSTEEARERARTPYTVVEQDFTIRPLQPRGGNNHAVFFTHSREVITYHYERNPADPRIQHALTLEVDDVGNVLKEAAIGYGRRRPDAALPTEVDQQKQTQALITYTEHRLTNAIDNVASHPDDYRTPLACETRTYELTGYPPTGAAGRFQSTDLVQPDPGDPTGVRLVHVFDGEMQYEDAPTKGKQRRLSEIQDEDEPTGGRRRRLIEHIRTFYRREDLTALLPLGEVEPLAVPGESYQLAFTPGLLARVFKRTRSGEPGESLLPSDPGPLLEGRGADQGGYAAIDGGWWIPSGRVYFDLDADIANPAATAARELNAARAHFFLPRKLADPFAQSTTVDYDAHDLLVTRTRDAVENTVTAVNDYRVLQPWLVTDPNRNRTAAAFDALGLVAGTAVMGKPHPAPVEGDSLEGFEADLTRAQIDGFFDVEDPHASAPDLLGGATARIIYDLHRFLRTREAYPDDPTRWLPAYAATLQRETHLSEPPPAGGLKIQIRFSYSDGFEREIQQKGQAEPKKIEGVAGPPRWVASGWTVFNNKGKPVRQFEPFFSAAQAFEFGVRAGVSPILFYDPLERVVATIHPNHTYEKVTFDPWQQTTWDANDTVLGDPRSDADIRGYTAAPFANLSAGSPPSPWQTWHAQREGGALGEQEQVAARKAAAHADTPTTAYLDVLGRPFLTVAHNRVVCPNHVLHGSEDHFHTRVDLDIEGNERAVRDAVTHAYDADGEAVVDELGRVVMCYDYDMLGNRIHQFSMEAGARWTLSDVAGNPIRAWDTLNHTFFTEYDPLRRPLRIRVTGGDPDRPTETLLTERLVYGEQHPKAERLNQRGALYLHLDQAGAAINEEHDFKGNLLRVSRRIATKYERAIDWSLADAALPPTATDPLDTGDLPAVLSSALDAHAYTSHTTYDALDRPVTLTTPQAPGMQPSVILHGYNEAGLLERLDVVLHGATSADGKPERTPFVTNIDYNARGQRRQIDYGNRSSTSYEYDPLTFRLVHLSTRRSGFPYDCPRERSSEWPGCHLQSLYYTYDPAGNITHIRDDAQQTIFFRNQRVEPSADYTYDATYRLIEATGREHLGQVGGTSGPWSYAEGAVVSAGPNGRFAPTDGGIMGTYVERYVYDAVGNFLKMQHRSRLATGPSWTRRYVYLEPSLLEEGGEGMPRKVSNRLSGTRLGTKDHRQAERYRHDEHGNMTRMPHLGDGSPGNNMHWDYRDQLRQVGLGGGGAAYYTYDSGGERVRKVWEKPGGLVEERIYLVGFEIFRKRQGSKELMRETLHVKDDQQRIALVETRSPSTMMQDRAPEQLTRYQLANHLGSAAMELDGSAEIISYEEYTPFGSTSYQTVRSQTEAAKRYRHIGKEQDEEISCSYHHARYYAGWLGRWLSCDPTHLQDDLNLYRYSRGSPLVFVDPAGTESRPAQISPEWVRRAPSNEFRAAFREIQERTQTPECYPERAVDEAVFHMMYSERILPLEMLRAQTNTELRNSDRIELDVVSQSHRELVWDYQQTMLALKQWLHIVSDEGEGQQRAWEWRALWETDVIAARDYRNSLVDAITERYETRLKAAQERVVSAREDLRIHISSLDFVEQVIAEEAKREADTKRTMRWLEVIEKKMPGAKKRPGRSTDLPSWIQENRAARAIERLYLERPHAYTSYEDLIAQRDMTLKRLNEAKREREYYVRKRDTIRLLRTR